jgi:uncharacterized protein YoxC
MESNIPSKIAITSSTIILASAFLILIAGILTTTTFVKVNAQGEGANQTMQQQQEPQQVANQTMEKAIQSANETGQDVRKVGSKVTEWAKDLVGNIGDKLQDLGK